MRFFKNVATFSYRRLHKGLVGDRVPRYTLSFESRWKGGFALNVEFTTLPYFSDDMVAREERMLSSESEEDVYLFDTVTDPNWIGSVNNLDEWLLATLI